MDCLIALVVLDPESRSKLYYNQNISVITEYKSSNFINDNYIYDHIRSSQMHHIL